MLVRRSVIFPFTAHKIFIEAVKREVKQMSAPAVRKYGFQKTAVQTQIFRNDRCIEAIKIEHGIQFSELAFYIRFWDSFVAGTITEICLIVAY